MISKYLDIAFYGLNINDYIQFIHNVEIKYHDIIGS